MTGPLIEYIVRQVTPIDQNISSIKYDIQVAFEGPQGYTSGPYVFRESKVSMVHNASLYANTSITGQSTSGSYLYNVSYNVQSSANIDIDAFYQRANLNAKAYFLNTYGQSQIVYGYTGSRVFSGSGITGSFWEPA